MEFQRFGSKAEMKSMRGARRIGVIGGSRAQKKHLEAAEEVGRLIAEAGAVLVCGGLAGVMEAACRGAKRAGGVTIGVLPGSNPAEANAFVDIPIATGMGYTRNALVVMNSDALIAVDGEYGTLSEIAYGCVHGKKIVGLETWDIKGVRPAGSPEEAVRLALEEP
jgi:uncharacterized protein (TIGR00725 family)